MWGGCGSVGLGACGSVGSGGAELGGSVRTGSQTHVHVNHSGDFDA